MRSPRLSAVVVPFVVCAALMCSGVPTPAASHSDAPLIKQDPAANLTDVYAFVGSKYNNPAERVLNVLAARGGPAAEALVDAPEVRAVSLTGSTSTGLHVAGRCAGLSTPALRGCCWRSQRYRNSPR